jgi:hypothetical protein
LTALSDKLVEARTVRRHTAWKVAAVEPRSNFGVLVGWAQHITVQLPAPPAPAHYAPVSMLIQVLISLSVYSLFGVDRVSSVRT